MSMYNVVIAIFTAVAIIAVLTAIVLYLDDDDEGDEE